MGAGAGGEGQGGGIGIDLIAAAGGVPDVFQMPAGRYWVRLTAWDRERVKRLYEEIGDRTDFEDEDPEFAALVEGAYGERYLAQFWPQLGGVSGPAPTSDQDSS